MSDYERESKIRIKDALQQANTTKYIEIGSGVIDKAARLFVKSFGAEKAMIIADVNTYKAAGEAVRQVLLDSSVIMLEPFVFDDGNLYAEIKYVEILEEIIKKDDAVPIAVGSGTINDLVKLAAYRCGRQYMVVVTAGSVDGYAAFGASITDKGFKQTFYCPAPRTILVDLNVLADAPKIMNAWGYADLIAKIPAGADWILADSLNVEALDKVAWQFVQNPLKKLIADSKGIASSERQALAYLTEGLIMSGLAMQYTESSRPASGAEHQFSHLWDNQHHTHNGRPPSHGFKVAIGALSSTALYEMFLNLPVEDMNFSLNEVKERWPSFYEIEKRIHMEFNEDSVADLVVEQSRAKYLSADEIYKRLANLQRQWPDLKKKLKRQLISFEELKEKLSDTGAPTEPEEIGIPKSRLRSSFRLAQYIRQRYTILDIMVEGGWLEDALERIFNSDKYFGRN